MERMSPSRPLTHDLFKNALEAFEIGLQEVIINNLVDGIFYAKLLCIQNGDTVEIDSRTSDAIAMAVRFGCPIYTYEFILDAAGIPLEEAEGQKEKSAPVRETKKPVGFNQYSLEELQVMLDDVLAAENYEKAAKIRDEINKRKGGGTEKES
jgi:bifunctional DNase/RNase